MILVKCRVMHQPENLKKALDADNPRLEGNFLPDKILKELTDIRKRMISTSAILKNYGPIADYRIIPCGLIFETKAKPAVVLPFDLAFFRHVENTFYFEQIKKSGLLKDLEVFVFDSVPAMAEKFSGPEKAIRALTGLLNSYKDELATTNTLYKYVLSQISRLDLLQDHNEVIFENKIAIEPLAFFGRKSDINRALKNAKIPTNLKLCEKIYPTAESYFKEHEVVYK